MEEAPPKKKGLVFFGRDLAQIPCLRHSLMTGVSSGVLTGLAYFMYSSNARRSSHIGFAGYIAVTSVAWMICRNRRVVISEEDIRAAIQAKLMTEGTELERQIQTNSKDV